MDLQKRREISALADVVRESLELSIPIDITEAVTRLGGTVAEVPDCNGPQEAMIRRIGERFEITVKQNHATVRKRFSVAHELGHLFLHMGYLTNPEKWGVASEYRDSVYHRFGYGIEEDEANLFAAALLMPEKEFQTIILSKTNDGSTTQIANIKQIANHFKTSAKAVVKRGEELGVLRVSSNIA
jgi:Zn-dependent peptidase ImmA (M78 family)